MKLKNKLKKLKTFVFFDLKWLIVHLIVEPLHEIRELLTNTKHTILKQDRPKELRKLFFMLFVVFAFTERQDIMVLGIIGFLISHVTYIYWSKKYINTMRKLTEKRIGVNYGKHNKNMGNNIRK